MTDYIELYFHNLSFIEREILIAELSEIGFEGFEEGVDDLKAFIRKLHFDETVIKNRIDTQRHPYSVETIPHQNWNQQWEGSFDPVVIGNFCAIRAAFHAPVQNVQHELIITPKMSFGTGHHATTSLVIQFMQEIDFSKKQVFDFGTGTGVLAILAEKLNAENILAIDNDEWSIINAKENILQNNCSKIAIEKADKIPSKQKFDIILANINKNVIQGNLGLIAKQLSNNGVLITSGLLKTDEKEIVASALKENLKLQKSLEAAGWIAMYFVNVKAS
jgi:ribosomal protein L11 methyltransferase